MAEPPTQRLALVTGASRGLGRAAARALGGASWHVVAVGRTVGALEDLDDEIKAAGGSATLVPLDLTETAALGQLGAAIWGRWQRLDLWLHTAVYAPPLQPAEVIAEKEMATAFRTNVEAFRALVHVLDPILRRTEGARALVAADDTTGSKFFGTYAATKAAQSALVRAWAAEAARRLTVAEIVPPPMPTAVRGRFFPGENRHALASCETVAARLLERLQGEIASGERLDLSREPVA